MVAHLFSVAFIGVIAYLVIPGSTLFSWHPFLMTLGFFGFMFQAIMVFSKESSLFSSFKYSNKVTIHVVAQTLAVFSILTAFAAIYVNKENNSREHFTTWHGLLGIVTIGYACVQYMAGYFVTQPRLRQLFHLNHIKQVQMQLYHATSGTFLFVLACICMGLGIFSFWFNDDTPFYVWYLAFALTSFLGLIISLQVTGKYVKPKYANDQASKRDKKASKKTK